MQRCEMRDAGEAFPPGTAEWLEIRHRLRHACCFVCSNGLELERSFMLRICFWG